MPGPAGQLLPAHHRIDSVLGNPLPETDLRYRLDELGWYQFESLMIALLKAELGLGIESWSAQSGDNGRDAFYPGTLPFPSKRRKRGPFIFQAKFTIARDPVRALRIAIKAEGAAILRRQSAGHWQAPRHYCLITNVELSPRSRHALEATLGGAIPGVTTSLLGGADVCASLDRHPNIRRSFPQLLGLADLTALLEGALSKEQRQRSEAAISLATRHALTFVPTQAYDRAWSVLREHSFAVLCGPPEMGKTTIAWMVALAQAGSGWETLLCRTPSDFFGNYVADRAQVFVADDAFGRTEYDPSLVLAWERDLHLMLPKLDRRHWLIWTSRKHLLERARQKMDLQQPAARFPDPGAIIVEASKLLKTEKALILYRHAKAHLESETDREVVKRHCRAVLGHPSFTPERIRNLVSWLPSSGVHALDGTTVARLIHEVIENPTQRMARAYGALHASHKWVLVALLESQAWATSRSVLEELYNLHCPAELKEPFDSIVDQLVDAFIHQFEIDDDLYYQWIHPSYRDLVIEELSSDDAIKKRFLSSADQAGIALALSGLGGAVGGRRLPLLAELDDWRRLRRRLKELVPHLASSAHAALLTQFSEAVETERAAEVKQELIATLSILCDEVRLSWDAGDETFTAAALRAYANASRWIDKIPPLPDVSHTWDAHVDACASEAENAVAGAFFDPDSLSAFANLASAVQDSEPRFLTKVGFPSAQERFLDLVERAVELELDSDISLDDNDDIESRASQFDEIASALFTLGRTHATLSDRFTELRRRLRSASEDLRAGLDYEPDPDDEERLADRAEDDLAAIFSDL